MERKENKIIFVSPGLSQKEMYGDLSAGGSAEALLGICYLAAVTRKSGFPTEIVDIPALGLSLEDATGLILKKGPKYVGFTAVSLAVDNAAKLAGEIKRRAPHIVTLIGGSHVTALPCETLERYTQFDIAVIGEGEDTIIKLLNALEGSGDISGVKGIIFRQEGRPIATERNRLIDNLDTLPMPAWDLLPDIRKHYRPTGYAVNKLPSFSLVASRGCSYQCVFCDRGVFGNRYRKHSPQYIMDMVKNLVYNYGVRDIRFNDDEFMLDKVHMRKVCQHITDAKLGISWSCLGRIDDVDMETLKIMKRSGCWQIRYGIESGSQKVLDAINKRLNLRQIENAINLTRSAKIRSIGFFMMGLPTETEDDLKKSIDFALKLKLDDFKINFMAPFPGSQVYNEIDKYGQANLAWTELHMHKKPSFVPYGLDEQTLIRYNRLAFRRFYLRPKIILSHILNVSNFGSFMVKLKGFLSVVKYALKQ